LLVWALISDVLSKYQEATADVSYLATSAFWHSLMGVDANGKPTTKVLTWSDTRSGRYTELLRNKFDESEVHNRTGARFHSSFWPAKLLWLRKERPEAFSKTARWISFSDYVQLRLCDEVSTSVSMASATGFFDQRRLEWDAELIKFLKLKRPQLSSISDQPVGLSSQFKRRWPMLRHAKVFPAIGDGAANNVGSGCVTKNRAALMIGTSGALRVAYRGDPPGKIPGGLWCYRIDDERMIVGGALSDGGGLYAYLKRVLNVNLSDEAIAGEIARRGADAHGLNVLPFFLGERSTGYHENASGAVIGLNSSHDAVDIIQAAMESVTYRFAEILDQLEKVVKIDEIVASGGALRHSPLWTQMIADVLGRPLMVVDVEEASLRGAVLLALESIGNIESIEEAFIGRGTSVEPGADGDSVYAEARRRHQRHYDLIINDQNHV
jgi:gluconokinase